jgi:photosystem II stability/assembly factor-like uncharacterized protein/pimeloyl-ACP methyl ester carboxylesterase
MLKTIKYILSILIFFIIYSSYDYFPSVFAADQSWTTGGPFNGNEMDLAIGKNNIYASGYNGVWESINRGFSWREKNNGIPTPYDVNNIEVSTNNDSLIFASTWEQGLYKSLDCGDNWVRIDSFPGNYIRKLKIDPYNDNILYVGTGSVNQLGTIYKTIDGGDHWQELNLGARGIIAYITIETTNSQIITTGIINSQTPGRYKSEDGGINWIKFSNENNIDFPDFPTANPQLYYKITNNKLYISLDKGNSWSLTNNNGLPGNFQIRYLTVDHNNAYIIFLFSIQHGVYKSTDAGNTWIPINNDLIGNLDLSLFQDLYIDKNNISTIYITTKGNGVWQYTFFELAPTATPTPQPTPTSLEPIVFLPGLGGSWNHENMILGIEKPQTEWYMTPGIKVYDGLIETFKNAGYKTDSGDRNLYIFNYNWTKPVVLIAEDLKNYIQNVVKPATGVKVNLVGHSLGGLVAETYVKDNQASPVKKIIILGSPLKGIPSIYYLWEGGNLSKAFNPWQRIGVGLLLHLRKPGFYTTMETARSVIPILKDLLPTFNYIKENSREKILSQMSQKNDWLLQFNSSLPENIFKITYNFIGVIPNSTIRFINVSTPSWIDKILGFWIDGKPDNDEYATGDQTVTTESATLNGTNIFNLENINHQELVTSIYGQQKIMDILNLNPSIISSASSAFNYESALVFQVASSVFLRATDANGNSLGEGDGKLIIIPNPETGQYQIELTGVDAGQYKLYIGQIVDNKDLWTTISDFIDNNRVISYKINFNNSSPLKNPLIDNSGETYFKTLQIQISDLENETAQKNYLPIVKKMIFFNLRNIKYSFKQHKIEKGITSLYKLRMQIGFWERIWKLDKKNAVFLKNTIQEIIENAQQVYIISENNKGGVYNIHRLKQELKLAQKFFNEMEYEIKKIDNKKITDNKYGALYLLAQEKLKEAKSSISYQSHINAIAVQFFYQETIIHK